MLKQKGSSTMHVRLRAAHRGSVVVARARGTPGPGLLAWIPPLTQPMALLRFSPCRCAPGEALS